MSLLFLNIYPGQMSKTWLNFAKKKFAKTLNYQFATFFVHTKKSSIELYI